ncbi:CocE/NonD family hydrolase [Rhodovibrionaceae bacterium A322]
MSVPDCDVRIEDHVEIPLSDGCRLSARIWRPVNAGPLPAILEYHPYPKRYSTAVRDEINHGWIAARGYVCLRVDLRGSGDSQGHLTDEYRPQEHADALEVIAWIAAQDWCDGAVGMFGLSWGGFNSLQIASHRPPALKAIAVAGATDDRYADDCHFRGGVMACEHIGWAGTLLSFLTRPPDPLTVGAGWRDLWLDRLSHLDWILPLWLQHPTRDDYWVKGTPSADYQAIEVPVLAAGGCADVFASSVLRMLEKMPDRVKGVIGPWAHKFPHMGTPGPAVGWLQECVDWWDHWLKGRDNGAETRPALRSFISQAAPPETVHHRDGRWVALSHWPKENQSWQQFGLRPGRLLQPGQGKDPATASSQQMTIASPLHLGAACGELMPMGWGADLPNDQRGDDALSVVFETEPLSDPLAVLGRPLLKLSLASDKPVASCFARLCDVAPDGKVTRVSYGALNLTQRNGNQACDPLQPGEFYSVEVTFDATSYCFLPGHRLRISLSSVYWPLFWPSPEEVRLTLDLSPSRLLLPLHNDLSAEPAAFAPADGAEALPRTVLQPADTSRSVSRDLVTGENCYVVTDRGAKEEIDAHGLVTWNETRREYRIKDGDPTSARMSIFRSLSVARGDWETRTETTIDFSGDKESFHSQARVTAWEGDTKLFEREWQDETPRQGH